VGPDRGLRHDLHRTTVNGREYVVLVDGKVVAGPFPTAAEADREREKLVKADAPKAS
jgi:hypothetical protein